MIRVVCLDFWHTLYENMPQNPKKEYIYRLIYDAFHQKVSINSIMGCIDNFEKTFNDNKQYSNLERIAYIEKQFHLYISEDNKIQLDKAISDAVIKYPPIMDTTVMDFLDFLKYSNYIICLVSDTNYSYGNSIRKIMENDGVLCYFDCLIFSDETKLRKPDPKIFKYISQKFNVLPSQCLFIGDSEKKDIIGPHNEGFLTAKKCVKTNVALESNCDIKFISFSDLKYIIKEVTN